MVSLLAFSLYILTASCKPVTLPKVTVDAGVIAGSAASSTVNQYLGIPFGVIPERFKKAQIAPAWRGTYDASSYKPSCIQQFNYPDLNRKQQTEWFNSPPPSVPDDEDCLNLNIYAPAGAEPGSKAVMFWIYGGGFNFGSAALPMYNGANLAENQDIIVVTANYRINVFGFPGSDQIPSHEQNLGYFDQRLALDWVQRNIRAFGGDPDRVTIVGESAGAGSVDSIVTLPPDPVPFQAAIMQSGQASIFLTQQDSANSWKKLVNLTNCQGKDSLQCIKKLPAKQIKEVVEKNALPFWPIHDNVTWDQTPRLNRIASKPGNSKIARVPILIGSNAQEATLLDFGESPSKQLAYTKVSFQCPAAVVAQDSAEAGIPTWRYYFNASFPNSQFFEGSGAYHSSEIGLIFGTYSRDGATDFQTGLSKVMQKAWADFIKNPQDGPGWDKATDVGVFNGPDVAEKPAVKVDKPYNVDKSCAQERLLYGVTGVMHSLGL